HINEICKVTIHDKAHNVRIKEFAGWDSDIEAMDNISKKKSDEDVSDDQDNIIDGQVDLHAEEGEIQEGKDVTNENVMHSQKFSWGEEIRNAKNLVASPIKQPMEDNNHMVTESPEGYRGESETLSKPPGFENFKQ
nr:hypothetical protein [Tanacetum cinerariifolium]